MWVGGPRHSPAAQHCLGALRPECFRSSERALCGISVESRVTRSRWHPRAWRHTTRAEAVGGPTCPFVWRASCEPRIEYQLTPGGDDQL